MALSRYEKMSGVPFAMCVVVVVEMRGVGKPFYFQRNFLEEATGFSFCTGGVIAVGVLQAVPP